MQYALTFILLVMYGKTNQMLIRNKVEATCDDWHNNWKRRHQLSAHDHITDECDES